MVHIHKPVKPSEIHIHNKVGAYIEKLKNGEIIAPVFTCAILRSSYCLHQKKLAMGNTHRCKNCKHLKLKENELKE